MRISSQSFMAASTSDWRTYSREQIAKLRLLPERADHVSAHRPLENTLTKAFQIVESIKSDKMPLPFVAAGSDGSVELTWRKDRRHELSCFIDDGTIVVVLIRDGRSYERDLDEPSQVNDYVDGLLNKI